MIIKDIQIIYMNFLQRLVNNMTQEQQEYFESFNNIQLVEMLINKIGEERILRNERDKVDSYNDIAEIIIDIKYMIIKRMGGCTGTGK